MLAVASAALVAVGVGLYSSPAGLITAGVEGLAGAYAWTYIDARTREVRRR